MDWMATLKTIAPTVATALLGPLGGIAAAAIGSAIGIPDATQDKIAKAISNGMLTPEHITEIKKLELQYQNDEKERDFKYAELSFKNQDSARKANVDGGTQKMLFWMSVLLLIVTLGSEIWLLFNGLPENMNEMVVGRVLGLLDAVAIMVMGYWYGSSSGSAFKNSLLSTEQAKV